MRARSFYVLLVFLILVLTAACSSAPMTQTAEPEIEPSVTPEPSIAPTEVSPTVEVTASVPAAEPPTEIPPTLDLAPLATITAGTELDIAFIHMIDTDNGWAIGGVNGSRDRILYTRDGALTFQDVSPPIGPDLESGIEQWAVGSFIDREHARVLYFPAILEPSPPGGADLVIWRTDDAGMNWSPSELISTSVLGTQDFPPRLYFLNPDTGWFLGRNGGAGMHRYPVSLYRTENGGSAWEIIIDAIGGSGLQSCRKTGWVFTESENGIATIDNCPVDGPAIEVTVDGGVNWERLILPPPLEDPDTVAMAYCETLSPGAIEKDIVVLSASCRAYDDPELQRELFYRSADDGQSWDGWDFPGGELLFLDERRGFALGREIYWTADGGVTWELRKLVSWDGQFSFIGPDRGWAVARAEDELALVVTEDSANTWKIIEPVLTP